MFIFIYVFIIVYHEAYIFDFFNLYIHSVHRSDHQPKQQLLFFFFILHYITFLKL